MMEGRELRRWLYNMGAFYPGSKYDKTMIRITVQQDGTLFVTSASGESQYEQPEQLPKDVRDKFYTLRAADPGTHIKGVGRRMSTQEAYWIEESQHDKTGDDGGFTCSYVCSTNDPLTIECKDKLNIKLNRLASLYLEDMRKDGNFST